MSQIQIGAPTRCHFVDVETHLHVMLGPYLKFNPLASVTMFPC